ncbi:hypothetical protein ACFFLS_05865 [Flavobacterium procerum]|uniref:TIGR04255 family protein n=1 Tax=Flavobacterium procerum TaxID=1455569 RepID=A0ABV6BM87_9FLAO
MDLRNIWIVKSLHKLIYPRQILPKKCYKLSLDFDLLKSQQQLYLIRRSNLPYEDTFEKLGDKYEINEDALINHPKDILGLSTNIAGGLFKRRHLKFRLIMNSSGNAKWTKKKRVFLYTHLKSISIKDGCPIYMNVNKIHKFPHDYKKPHTNELINFLKSIDTNPIIEKNEGGAKILTMPGTCIVKHDPLILNYWHAEFQLIDVTNEKEITKYGSKWLETYCNDIINNAISRNCMPYPANLDYKLDKSCYTD